MKAFRKRWWHYCGLLKYIVVRYGIREVLKSIIDWNDMRPFCFCANAIFHCSLSMIPFCLDGSWLLWSHSWYSAWWYSLTDEVTWYHYIGIPIDCCWWRVDTIRYCWHSTVFVMTVASFWYRRVWPICCSSSFDEMKSLHSTSYFCSAASSWPFNRQWRSANLWKYLCRRQLVIISLSMKKKQSNQY
jgi:hypothetical protein